MDSIIQIFRMSELSVDTRIKIIKKLGYAINNQMGGNFTEALVIELVIALDHNQEDVLKNDKHYAQFMQ